MAPSWPDFLTDSSWSAETVFRLSTPRSATSLSHHLRIPRTAGPPCPSSPRIEACFGFTSLMHSEGRCTSHRRDLLKRDRRNYFSMEAHSREGYTTASVSSTRRLWGRLVLSCTDFVLRHRPFSQKIARSPACASAELHATRKPVHMKGADRLLFLCRLGNKLIDLWHV